MKKITVIGFVLLFIAVFTKAQGIRFENGLTWEQVLAKAKSENKYIFVDCYATWCGPCKDMDMQIYPLQPVGDYMNTWFISIKLQMDQTSQDNEELKQWYGTTALFLTQYKITVFPSFLFFSADGTLVHKGIGSKDSSGFLQLAAAAVDPDKQYYTALAKYRTGKMDYTSMRSLAKSAKEMGDKEIADSASQDYLKNYLYTSNDEQLYTADNVSFISDFIKSSDNKGFDMFYLHSDKVDKIKWMGYSRIIVDYVIAKEFIDPQLWPENGEEVTKPDWNQISSVISNKFNKTYADRTVLGAQIRWYSSLKEKTENDWSLLAKYNVEEIDKYGLDTTGMGMFQLNNMIWEVIFQHSNDKAVLKKAIKWEYMIVMAHPDDLPAFDTYANLLYKSGDLKNALIWEKKAVDGSHDDKDIQANFNKMKNGEKTW